MVKITQNTVTAPTHNPDLNSGLQLQLFFIASLSLHAAYSSLQLLQLKILLNTIKRNKLKRTQKITPNH